MLEYAMAKANYMVYRKLFAKIGTCLLGNSSAESSESTESTECESKATESIESTESESIPSSSPSTTPLILQILLLKGK